VAQSSELVEKDIFTKDVYNNLRKDVLDPSLGHGHHGDADTGVQIILSGTYAAIPAASSDNKGWLYLATDRGVLYRSDGATWSQCGVALDLDETIAGVKTFSSIPILPGIDPTASNEAVRKAYADKIANLRLGFTEPVIAHQAVGIGGSLELGPASAGESWLCYLVGSDSYYLHLYFGILKNTTWVIRRIWMPNFGTGNQYSFPCLLPITEYTKVRLYNSDPNYAHSGLILGGKITFTGVQDYSLVESTSTWDVIPPAGETWLVPVTIGQWGYWSAGPVIGGVATLVTYSYLDPTAPLFFVVTNSTPLRLQNRAISSQYLGYAGWKV